MIAMALALLAILSSVALAKTVDEILPDAALWTATQQAFAKKVRADYTEVKVGRDAALKATGIDVDGYAMDGYYVFGQDVGKNKGLSRITYVLSSDYARKDVTAAGAALMASLEEALGKADAVTNALSTWKRDGYTVEAGIGKYKAYTGSERQNMAIVLSYDPTSKAKAAVKPTKTPSPAAAKSGKRQTYILNKSTKKFHKPDCSDVNRIKEENREAFSGTREEVVNMGYDPCGHCKP